MSTNQELNLSSEQQALYDILQDGEPHLYQELMEVFKDDPVADREYLAYMMGRLRKKLLEHDHTVVYQNLGKYSAWRIFRLPALRVSVRGE